MGHLRLLVFLVTAVLCLPSSRFRRVRSSSERSILEVPTVLGGLLGGLVENVLLNHAEIRFEIIHSLAQFVHLISEVSYRIFFFCDTTPAGRRRAARRALVEGGMRGPAPARLDIGSDVPARSVGLSGRGRTNVPPGSWL